MSALTWLLTSACGTVGDDRPAHQTSAAQTTASATAQTSTLTTDAGPAEPALLGVFRGTRRTEVASFESWLGRKVDAVVDFAAADSWAQIADPTYLLEHWHGTPYRLVLSVPLYPIKESADRKAAAAGAYDHHFAALGRRLVQHGRGDSWIRLGWEFNMAVSYSYSTDPGLFTAYYRRAIAAMRSAPGQQFTIVWNPGSGQHQQDASAFYPGDDVVDVIGLDIYDSGYHLDGYPYPPECNESCRTGRADFMWDTMLYGGQRGLRFWVDFAVGHSKPIALPEWGLWSGSMHAGGGDNPLFIHRMHEFISDPRNRVVLHAYFEHDNPTDTHSLMRSFPSGGSTFRDYWGPS